MRDRDRRPGRPGPEGDGSELLSRAKRVWRSRPAALGRAAARSGGLEPAPVRPVGLKPAAVAKPVGLVPAPVVRPVGLGPAAARPGALEPAAVAQSGAWRPAAPSGALRPEMAELSGARWV